MKIPGAETRLRRVGKIQKTSSLMRNLIWAAILTLTPSTQSHSQELPNVCAYFDDGTRLVTFTVRMQLEQTHVEFKVPENFIEGRGRRRDGIVTTARLFTVDAHTFEPLTRQQQGDLNKAGKLNGLNFLIQDVIPESDLANGIIAAATLMPRKLVDFDSYETAPYGFDLLEVQIPRTDRREVFVGTVPQASGRDIISCNTLNGTSQVPLCSHYFRSSSNVDVNASYRRTELARWHELRNQIEGFLLCSTNKE